VRWVNGTIYAGLIPGVRNLFIAEKVDALLTKLALAEEAQDRHGARDYLIQALDLMQQDRIGFGAEKEFLWLLQIALVSSTLKMSADAIHYYTKALDLSEKVFGKDGINNFTIINKLAIEYETQGHLRNAECLYRRSLAGRLKEPGPDHLDSVMTTQELGTIMSKLGNRESARRLLETAYIGFENLTEPDEETALITLNNLAATYAELEMKTDAARLLSIAIPRLSQVLGVEHEKVPYTICNYLRFATEPVIMRDVLKIIESYQAKPNRTAVIALEDYAHFLVEHSQIKQAVDLYQMVFQWRKKNFGRSHSETIAALWKLAESHDTLDMLDEAEELFEMIIKTPGLASIAVGESYRSASVVRIKRLRSLKEDLRRESVSWGLDKPRPCACGQPTFRLCSRLFALNLFDLTS
jgi:tetratricopeptide (TPR) repeat protein